MTTVHIGEDAVGDREQGGFGRVMRTETMLGWGKEMIVRHVKSELALHYTLDDFGYMVGTMEMGR